MSWSPKHSQVDLPELGFAVDEGMEGLIRACWRRGVATDISCIGSDDFHDGDAWIGFFSPMAAERWVDVTGVPVEWGDNEEVATAAEAYFPAAYIPGIVNELMSA